MNAIELFLCINCIAKVLSTNFYSFCFEDVYEELLKNIVPICKTDGSGKDKNEPCEFPFKFRRSLHNGCITEGSKDGIPWCATAVDKNGHQVKGKWGNCEENTCQPLDFRARGILFLNWIQSSND